MAGDFSGGCIDEFQVLAELGRGNNGVVFLARQYGVTYPTVRLRLDRLIQKIQLSDQVEGEPYIALIKRLALQDKLDFDTAKLLITQYKKQQGGE